MPGKVLAPHRRQPRFGDPVRDHAGDRHPRLRIRAPAQQFILINTTVSLFSSVIPVPGGIGVTEAGLTWGLTAAGIPNDTAFAIALTHRLITFYLPPFWGFMCYQWLIKHRFL